MIYNVTCYCQKMIYQNIIILDIWQLVSSRIYDFLLCQHQNYFHKTNFDISSRKIPSTFSYYHINQKIEFFSSFSEDEQCSKEIKKNFMAPFYGWGSTASRLEPLRGGSLLFTTKFPEILNIANFCNQGLGRSCEFCQVRFRVGTFKFQKFSIFQAHEWLKCTLHDFKTMLIFLDCRKISYQKFKQNKSKVQLRVH